MQKKSSISTAMWFIPLLAILLACAFIFVYWMGRVLLRSTPSVKDIVLQNKSSQESTAPGTSVPIIPPTTPVEPDEENVPPQEVLDMGNIVVEEGKEESSPSEVCPATSVPVKMKKPTRAVTYTPYEKGLRQCKRQGVFPCAWEDKSAKIIKQYWLMGADGPITRGIYNMGGDLISETMATVNGTVTSYAEQNTTWYFDGGMLVKIRTSPYDNCNLHDWFFIREDGKQDVCQCAYTVEDCCARSPYQERMKRSYCDLFPSDKDFCR